MNDSSSFMKRWIRLFILQLRRNLYVSATIATLLCSYLALNQVSLPVQRCAAVKVTSKLRTRLTGLVRRPKGFQTESSPQEATPDNEAEISFCQLNQLARYWTGQYSSAVEDCWFTNARRPQDSLGASSCNGRWLATTQTLTLRTRKALNHEQDHSAVDLVVPIRFQHCHRGWHQRYSLDSRARRLACCRGHQAQGGQGANEWERTAAIRFCQQPSKARSIRVCQKWRARPLRSINCP